MAATKENNITELRDILFETLRGLKNKTVDTEQAKAINDTAQVIINSAKLEVDYVRHTGAIPATNFLQSTKPEKPANYVHRIGERHS